LDEFFEGMPQAAKRIALEGLFGATPDRVTARIKADPDFAYTFCGFRKFLEQDLGIHGTGGAKSKHGEGKRMILKTAARGLISRNYAYGRMMRVNFREHIRLTIHPSANGRPGIMQKFSINLIGASDWGTPWHNCALLQKDGTWTLIRKCDAEKRNLTLATFQAASGALPYFAEVPPDSSAALPSDTDHAAKHDPNLRMATGADGLDTVVGGDGTGVTVEADEYDPSKYTFKTKRHDDDGGDDAGSSSCSEVDIEDAKDIYSAVMATSGSADNVTAAAAA
jgi:hypothetical protein